MNNPPTDRTAEFYGSLVAFQNTHRLPGLQHAQIRGLLAEHLARAFPAGLVAVPPTGQTALRDRIRQAVCEAEGFGWDTDMLEPDEYGEVADAVLAVLPPPADRAVVLSEADRAMLHYALNQAQLRLWRHGPATEEDQAALNSLRRLADEAQPPKPVKLPFVHTDDDGDRLTIGAVMASTYDGEAPVVAVAAEQYDGDETATVYVRPERVEQVVTALRAARKAAEALPAAAHSCGNCEGIDPDTCLTNPGRPAAASAGVQTDEEARP